MKTNVRMLNASIACAVAHAANPGDSVEWRATLFASHLVGALGVELGPCDPIVLAMRSLLGLPGASDITTPTEGTQCVS